MTLPVAKAPTDSELVERTEELHDRRARALAQELAPDAVKLLGKIIKGKRLPGNQVASPTVMRQAAVDILTQAHGRPETRDPRVQGGDAGGGGLTIVINQFGSTPRTIDLPKPVREAIEVASEIEESDAGPR